MGAAAAGLVLAAGLVAGQFRRGVVEELRSSLRTAKDEIDIQRERGDRLDAENKQFRTELEGLRRDVATLRTVVVNEGKLAEDVAAALKHETEMRTQEVVDSIVHAIGQGTALAMTKMGELMDRIDEVSKVLKAVDNAVNQKLPGAQTISEEVSDIHRRGSPKSPGR